MKETAKAAARAAVPELAVPLEALARSTRRPESSSPELPVVLVPPDDARQLLRWGRDKVKVRTRDGVRYVQVERRHGASFGEVLEGALVVLLAAGTFELAKDGKLPSLVAAWHELPGGSMRSPLNPRPPPWNASNPLGWLNVPAWF